MELEVEGNSRGSVKNGAKIHYEVDWGVPRMGYQRITAIMRRYRNVGLRAHF